MNELEGAKDPKALPQQGRLRASEASVDAGEVDVEALASWCVIARTWDRHDPYERDYKIALGADLGEARSLFLAGDPEWPARLKRALQSPKNNIIHHIVVARLVDWMVDHLAEAEEAFRSLWGPEGTATERLGGFLGKLPREAVSGAGIRLSVGTALLLGVDPENFPLFKPMFARRVAKAAAAIPPDRTSELSLYTHWVALLSSIREAIDLEAAEIRDLLDMQGSLWSVFQSKEFLESLGVGNQVALERFREGDRDAVPGSIEDQVADASDSDSDEREPKPSWIFQGNPKYFDVRGALAELPEMTWLVNQGWKQMNAGESVFIWESGAEGGVIARGVILTDPAQMPEDEGSKRFARQPDMFTDPARRVRVRIDEVLDQPLLRDRLKDHPILHSLTILHAPNATNFRLKEQEAVELEHLFDGDEEERRCWLIAAGRRAELWQDFFDNAEMRIGYGRKSEVLGDLSGMSYADISEAIAKVSGRVATNDTRALYQFAAEIQVGDLVLVKKGRHEIVGYGVVTGPYRHDGEEDFAHMREVDWLARGEWVVPEGTMLPMKTLTEITHKRELLDAMLPLFRHSSNEGEDLGDAEPYTWQQALEGLFIHPDVFRRIVDALRAKKNVILQGPPGVGKTFISRRVAYALMGEKDSTRISFVQFHQSTSYEDFVQGWRPSEGGGFVRKNGPFFEFCQRARVDPDRPYVFIIDEINRGNLSKVFGELMMLIEADKRGQAIPLLYASASEERFSVPDNVYILGMMNTADRSLAMVDYALRRRFRFFSLEPRFDSDVFRQHLSKAGADPAMVDRVVSRLGDLNAEIRGDRRNLGPGFCVGHSYFVDGVSTDLDEAWYRDVMETEIVPLLEEYWFDRPEKVESWSERLLE